MGRRSGEPGRVGHPEVTSGDESFETESEYVLSCRATKLQSSGKSGKCVASASHALPAREL